MLKHTLDNPKTYQKLDQHHVYDSIINFNQQISQSWSDISYSKKLKSCFKAENIIISGMGGSALGGRIIESLSQSLLRAPLEIVNNYRLPAYVNSKTLVVISSYSGNTEETLSTAMDALKRRAQIFIITTGGKLAELANRHQLPAYIIEPQANPSGQPRLGLGYSITAQLALLAHCRFIHLNNQDIQSVIKHLHKISSNFEKTVPLKKNPAKSLAQKTKGQAIALICANHLSGAAHAVKNMINENAKTFSINFSLPELNHHLLEGLNFPSNLKNNLHFLIINSSLYPQAIKNRLEITKEVFLKLGYSATVIKPSSSKPLLQAFEVLYFGQLFSFYLSLLNKVDPGPIPWVDYFKKQLSKQSRRSI